MGIKVENFEDLECWREARVLTKMVYDLTGNSPLSKDFGLKDQMQRAAVSVMANIAEGFETFSDPEFIRFLGFSLRSCAEVRSHLFVALDISYISPSAFDEIHQQSKKCTNYIKALLKYLRGKSK